MENLVIDTAERVTTARLLTPAELGLCVRLFREMRQWSQEQLAEISGLNVRTIQRVEQGLGAWAAEGKSRTATSTTLALNKHGHQLPPV